MGGASDLFLANRRQRAAASDLDSANRSAAHSPVGNSRRVRGTCASLESSSRGASRDSCGPNALFCRFFISLIQDSSFSVSHFQSLQQTVVVKVKNTVITNSVIQLIVVLM